VQYGIFLHCILRRHSHIPLLSALNTVSTSSLHTLGRVLSLEATSILLQSLFSHIHFEMAKLAYMLALVQATLIYGRPGVYDQKRHAKFHEKREITLSSSLDITTSYSSALISSLQSATVTVSPSITAVRLAPRTTR
jgi:hypothetical protein